MLLIMLYGIYSIKYYYFIINEIILMSQLRQALTTDVDVIIIVILTRNIIIIAIHNHINDVTISRVKTHKLPSASKTGISTD